MSAPSRSAANRRALLCLMGDGRWRPGSLLRSIGGDRFAARLHELRTLGIVDYHCRRIRGAPDNAFEYRLLIELPPPEAKKTRVTLRKRLLLAEAEVARLTARVAELERRAA